MSQIPQPYDSLLAHFRQHLSGPDSQLVNLALWVYGVFKARSCHLSRVADELPVEGQKDSLMQRLKRWLMNARILPTAVYQTLLTTWLRHWPAGRPLVVLLDRTEVADRFNLLLLAVAWRGRAIPLTWTLLGHAGACRFPEQHGLLDRILPLLPAHARSTELLHYATAHHWDYAVGHKGDCLIWHPDTQTWHRLDALPVQPGHPVYLEGVLITQQHRFGPVNLIAYWDDHDDCPRYRVTNRPANGLTLHWTRMRRWIEGLFRDYTSGGFQLDATRLEHADRLDHLLLVLALATLWFVAIGRRVVKMGHRSVLDSASTRAHSYFHLGWSWLKKQANLHRPLRFLLHVYS